MVREIRHDELRTLLELYLHLHEESVPEISKELTETWEQILNDEHHHILVNEIHGEIVSSCVCIILPNLTRGGKPYALIENVVTHKDHRGNGYATQCLAHARKLAEESGCYKIKLMTGAKDEKTLDFYRKAGFVSGEKTGFIIKL